MIKHEAEGRIHSSNADSSDCKGLHYKYRIVRFRWAFIRLALWNLWTLGIRFIQIVRLDIGKYLFVELLQYFTDAIWRFAL